MTDRDDTLRTKGGGDQIRRRVRQTIAEHGMVARGDRVLVAVSGGPDSMALLHVLAELRDERNVVLGIAHLDHNLRGKEGRADADFVAAVADEFEMPFYGERLTSGDYREFVHLSIEEAARRLRYRFLEHIARRYGYARIAIGHNADDNAESVLLFLLRGSGPAGLTGIRPTAANGIIRPLINLKRSEILRYLDSCDVKSVADRSNLDMRYVRNRIRHQLLPEVQRQFNPNIVETLNRLAQISRDEERWLQTVVRPHFEATVESRDRHRIVLAAERMRAMPCALQRRILRMAIAEVKGDLRRVGFAHIESVRDLIEELHRERSVDLPGTIRGQLSDRRLMISSRGKARRKRARPVGIPPASRYEYRVDSPADFPCILQIEPYGRRIRFSAIGSADGSDGLNAGQAVAFFDMDKLDFPLVIRGVRAGDRFSPSGVPGTQKVKKFFIDHKVPRAERTACPVLVSGGRIIWLVGHRIDAAYASNASSRAVLKVELLLV